MTDDTGTGRPLWNAAEPAGKADTERAVQLLSARLPSQLAIFAHLAYDFAGFWHVEGRRLFAKIDPHTWESSERNPVRFLAECPTAKLAQAAQDLKLSIPQLTLAVPLIQVMEITPVTHDYNRKDSLDSEGASKQVYGYWLSGGSRFYRQEGAM